MEQKQFKLLIASLGTLGVLTLFSTCNSCNNGRSVQKIQHQLDSLTLKMEKTSTKEDLRNVESSLDKSLQIEGLKSESRMIQATDRKMLDVQRQNEIEKEIAKLKK